MSGTELGANTELRDEGLNSPTPPEEAIPGKPANNLMSYALMALLAVIMLVGGLMIFGTLPDTQNDQTLPGRLDNVPGG